MSFSVAMQLRQAHHKLIDGGTSKVDLVIRLSPRWDAKAFYFVGVPEESNTIVLLAVQEWMVQGTVLARIDSDSHTFSGFGLVKRQWMRRRG